MKKYLFILCFLISTQQLWSHNHELKIYRKGVNKLTVAATIATWLVFGVGGAAFTAGSMAFIAHHKGNAASSACEGMAFSAVVSLAALIGAPLKLISLAKWHSKRKKPILIYDEEGFTYEQPRGFFKGRKDVRYLWKDVIGHWSEGVVTYSGRELEKKWCYHVDDKKDLVKIDALELDIPDESRAKIESVRRGFLRALYS